MADTYSRIDFKEEQRQVLSYDYLVFVCGVEISKYTKSIEVTHQGRGGIGSATIVLANPFDQWIMTRSNLNGSYRMSNDKYSERPKWEIYNKKKNPKLNFTATGKKVDKSAAIGGAPKKVETDGTLADQEKAEKDPNTTQKLYNEEFLQRYSFGPGSCIFSKMDPVRIFIRNPYNNPDTTDYWIPFFTGTIDTKPFTTNYITGESTITLNCYDVRGAMQGMRVGINPFQNNILGNAATAGSGESVASTKNIPVFDAGYFADRFATEQNNTNSPNGNFSNIFAGKHFVDCISLLITGRTSWVNLGGEGVKETPLGGVGEFTPGKVFRYYNSDTDPAANAPTKNTLSDLTKWDMICLFGETGKFWTLEKCLKVGKGSMWGGPYHPFIGKLHWLLPSDKLLISGLINETFNGVKDIMGSPDWTDRYSLLNQICSQVDYEVTVTGNGDIVMEFPMYDFHPKYFRHSAVYTVEQHIDSDSISDEGGEVLAGLEATGSSSNLVDSQAVSQLQNTDKQLNVQGDLRVAVFSNTLASKYGARIQSVSLHGVNKEESLLRLAIVEFQKRLAEANKLSFNMVFRPYIRSNRPLLYAEKNRIRLGKTNSVTYSLPVLQEATMSVSVGCVRLPLLKNKKDVVFQHITGAEGMAMSYNSIFDQPSSNSAADIKGDMGIQTATKNKLNTPK